MASSHEARTIVCHHGGFACFACFAHPPGSARDLSIDADSTRLAARDDPRIRGQKQVFGQPVGDKAV
jgi:hypothetical protein